MHVKVFRYRFSGSCQGLLIGFYQSWIFPLFEISPEKAYSNENGTFAGMAEPLLKWVGGGGEAWKRAQEARVCMGGLGHPPQKILKSRGSEMVFIFQHSP